MLYYNVNLYPQMNIFTKMNCLPQEKLEAWLSTIRFSIQKEMKNKSGRFVLNQSEF